MTSTTAGRFVRGSTQITRASPASRGMISAAARRELAVEVEHDERGLELAFAELVDARVQIDRPAGRLQCGRELLAERLVRRDGNDSPSEHPTPS